MTHRRSCCSIVFLLFSFLLLGVGCGNTSNLHGTVADVSASPTLSVTDPENFPAESPIPPDTIVQEESPSVNVPSSTLPTATPIPTPKDPSSPAPSSPTPAITTVPQQPSTPADSTPVPSSIPTPEPDTIVVTIAVDCKLAVSAGYKEALAVSSSGIIMNEKKLILKKGSTVYDALKASGISVGSQASAMGRYVYAIASLREKVCGSQSGWIYSVNGAVPSKSCSNYALSHGDVIRWRYSLNGGKDL